MTRNYTYKLTGGNQLLTRKNRKPLASLLALGLISSLIFPNAATQAATPVVHRDTPVLMTVPAANAEGVRPDTQIELKLDPQHKSFSQWNRKYADEVTLTLLNDGGQAVYSSKLDSELRYDATSGTLTFTPPEPLARYTTYGVVISADEKLPSWLAADPNRKNLPQPPAFKTEELDPEAIRLAHETKTAESTDATLPSVVEKPQDKDAQAVDSSTSPILQKIISDIERNRQQKLKQAQAMTAEQKLVGPKPVRAIPGAWHPINAAEGENQKGVIEQIDGSVVTLFDGRQLTVTADTHIHVPDLPGTNTLADLKPGDFVNVTVNSASTVKNINVVNKKDVVSYVFTTGSALHEPTHVTLEQTNQSPRVTEDGTFTLVSTDDYGLPAWGSETSIEVVTDDGTDLHSSVTVLPGTSFTTSDPLGRTDVTVTDHFPQKLAVKVSMNGPHYDGYDAHGLVAWFDFRPGLPANATIEAPASMTVGSEASIKGSITDVYGNPVEENTSVLFAASAGEIVSPVYTRAGRYETAYTASTKVQTVSLRLKTAEGTASADASIELLPDEPAQMTWETPATLAAGESADLTGTVSDRYGNAVQDGTNLILTASQGELPAHAITADGQFTVSYTAPEKAPQRVQVAAVSEIGSAFAERQIEIVPGPAAELSLQAEKTFLYTDETTALSGYVTDRFRNLIEKQAVELTAQHGTLSDPQPVTDAYGLYSSSYTAPFYNGIDTLTATAGNAQATLDLTLSSAGTGVNPGTGQIEKVARLAFEQSSYQASPGKTILLVGHAYNANNQPLQDVVFSSSQTTAGSIVGLSYKTDVSGTFSLTYAAPASQATATVTVATQDIIAETTVNTLAFGYGYNPTTGQWEKVGSIEILSAGYKLDKEYSINLFPGQTVEFTGRVTNENGQPLAQVQFDRVYTSSGTLTITSAPQNDGSFRFEYVTPSQEGNQLVQLSSGDVQTSIYAAITTYGYGFNPATGVWEPVASITFNPNQYSVNAGSSITLNGSVKNALGEPLSYARVNITKNGGTTTNQVISQTPTGAFSLTYIAPGTAGSYTVRGYVNAIYGDAVINVLPPRPAYFENPVLNLYGSAYGEYFSGYVDWRARVFKGDGTPMTYGVNTNLFIVLDESFLSPIDFDTPSNGYVYGSNPGVAERYSFYSMDRYGITYHFSFHFYMRAFDGYHYADPMMSKSFFPKSYVSCGRYGCY